MGCRVLLAEDDDDLRSTLASILEREGYRPRTFKGGVQALAALRDHKSDVVLLDLNIRDIDGDEFLRHQAGDPLISSIPVIVIAGRPAKRLPPPVVAMLQKPFDVNALLRAVSEGCG
jgi:CheY-like chemotaxis protein